MDVGPQLQRIPAPDLEAAESDPALVAAIRDEIERAGPIPFARFMELALYHPDPRLLPLRGGAPRARRRLPDRAGGPPDLRSGHRPARRRRLARRSEGPMASRSGSSGRGVARWRPRSSPGWRPTGPTSPPSSAIAPSTSSRDGSTSSAIGSRGRGRRPARGRRRRADRRDRHRERGPRRAADAPGGRARRPPPGDPRRRGATGRFVDVEAEPSTPALAQRLAAEGIELADGQLAEICLAVDGWVAGVAAGLNAASSCSSTMATRPTELYDAPAAPAERWPRTTPSASTATRTVRSAGRT